MRTGPTAAIALVGVLLVALVAGSVGATAPGARTARADLDAGGGVDLESCAADSPDDFGAPAGGDAIGYVDGYWHDEPIVLPAANDTTHPEEPSERDQSAGNGSSSATSSGGSDATSGNETSGPATSGNETDAPENDGSETNGSETNGSETDEGETDGSGIDGGETASDTDSARTNGSALEGTFDASDGLNDRELAALVARTAARVEAVRCLSFESVPTVRVVNRSSVRERQRRVVGDRPVSARRFDDARLSTALLLGDDVNASEARAATTATATLGYYDAAADSIVVVAENGTASGVDEPTLAHELVHALQDQHFDLERFDANRTDAALAERALIEGDATLVAHRYRTRCTAGDWATECLEASTGTGTNSEHLGLELFRYHPYNEGGAYVASLYADGGWATVNDRYDDPPASTRELLYPATSPAFRPASVEFQPVSDPAWERLEPAGRPGFDVLGPGSIGAAMIAPTFDAESTDLYSAREVRNGDDRSTLDPLEPYDYAVDATAGWEGGRLEVYVNEANQTATRWRIEWESEAAAAVFRTRFVKLLEVRGAASSRTYVGTFHFPPARSFDGRYAIRQNGTTVTVVHGPDLDSLRALDPLVAREPREGSSSSMRPIPGSKRVAEDAIASPGGLGAAVGFLIALGLIGFGAVRRR